MAEKKISDESLPALKIPKPTSSADLASIFGLVLSFGLIVFAIALGQSNANFVNLPSVMIVILGTITATSISYSGTELKESLPIISTSMFRTVQKNKIRAGNLLNLATISRKKGLLYLSNYENQIKNESFLNYAVDLAIDGYNEEDITRVLKQNIETMEEQGLRAASILRRASEVAPAMGLIGTLVGLVQMLADLSNPETIGPAMAVALLTTFYGAIMGTVVMSPLSAKIEKQLNDEIKAKTMVLKTVSSMIKQENPRSLEIALNSLLLPSERVNHFK